MSKTIRFLVLSSCLALSALFITGANAQTNFCASIGLNDQDCELITTATENTQSAGAVAITYEGATSFVTGFFDSDDTIEGATGVLVYDADGTITSARIDIPTISSVTSFSEGLNALSFVLIDNVVYIGVGDSLDDLTWQQLPDSLLAERSFSINSLIAFTQSEAASALTGLGTDALAWNRSDVGNETVLQISLSDVDPFSDFDADIAELGDTTISGTLNGSVVISVNNDSNTISNIISTMYTTYSVDTLDTGAVLEDQEMTEEEANLFADLFGGLMGENEQSSTMVSNLGLSVENVDTSIIVAPDTFEPVSDDLLETLSYFYISDVFSFISEYYTEYTFATGFSFDFGSDAWDFNWDLSAYYYNDMCSESYRNHNQQASIPFGTSVNSTLGEGNADIWTFDANEGDVITLIMRSQAFDSYLELVGPDGTGLASDDDGAGGYDSQISEYTLEQSGTFKVVACSYSSDVTGEYTLSLGN